MASNGKLIIDIDGLRNIYEKTCSSTWGLEMNLYNQCNNLYNICNSSYIAGKFADALKSYLYRAMININGALIDLLASCRMEIELSYRTFEEIECNDEGIISEDRIISLNDFYNEIKNGYADIENEAFGHLLEASDFIPISDVSMDDVKQMVDWMGLTFFDICRTVEENDDLLLSRADAMYERILSIRNLITNVRNNCYTGGYFDVNSVSWLNSKNNQQLPKLELSILLKGMPFEYDPNVVTLKEEEWMGGLVSDVFASSTYSTLSFSREDEYGDNTAFSKAKASVFESNQYLRLSEAVRASVNSKLLYGKGVLKKGFDDDYVGFNGDFKAGVASVDGTIMLGNDDVNKYIKGNAEVACVDSHATFEINPSDSSFDIGAGLNVVGATVGGKIGVGSAIGKNEVSKYDSIEDMFYFEAGASVGPQAGAGIDLKKEKAFETEKLNVYALNSNGIVKFLIPGASVAFTVPIVEKKGLYTTGDIV